MLSEECLVAVEVQDHSVAVVLVVIHWVVVLVVIHWVVVLVDVEAGAAALATCLVVLEDSLGCVDIMNLTVSTSAQEVVVELVVAQWTMLSMSIVANDQHLEMRCDSVESLVYKLIALACLEEWRKAQVVCQETWFVQAV